MSTEHSPLGTIRYAVADGVAAITLNRPDKLNSLTLAMLTELRHALEMMNADPAVRVLLLTGSGRGFCAGQDLADPAMQAGNGRKPDIGAIIERNYKPVVTLLSNARVPTLAAVNGIAAGAGVSLALACDLVVATNAAVFIQAFSKVGLIPDAGGTWFLPQRVGMARAMGLALLAEKLPADQAAAWGLIWAAYKDEEFQDKVEGLARQLSTAPTKALVRTRQAMRLGLAHSLEQQLDLEGYFARELGWSDNYAEGVAAFAEKRPARFKEDTYGD